MNRALLDQIVNATLYEGYILYPYRASSKKNRRELPAMRREVRILRM